MGLFDDLLNDICGTHGINKFKVNAEDEYLKPIDMSKIHPFENRMNQDDKKEDLQYQGAHSSGEYRSGSNLPPIDKFQTRKQSQQKVHVRDVSVLKVALILSIIIAIVQLFVDMSLFVAIMIIVVGVEVGLCLTGLSTGQSFEPSMVFFFLFSTVAFVLLAYCSLAYRPDDIIRILATVCFCIPQIMLIVIWD